MTRGYRLPARYVIHTVGPVWRGGDHGEDELLANCYRNSLRIASEHRLSHIAFPAISTGVYGFPMERAARIALREVSAFLASHDMPQEVTLVCYDRSAYEIHRRAFEEAFGS